MHPSISFSLATASASNKIMPPTEMTVSGNRDEKRANSYMSEIAELLLECGIDAGKY